MNPIHPKIKELADQIIKLCEENMAENVVRFGEDPVLAADRAEQLRLFTAYRTYALGFYSLPAPTP